MVKGTEGVREKEKSSGTFAKLVDILAAVRLFFGELKGSLLEHAEGAVRRVQVLFVLYLWISAGVLLMLLGVFDLLIVQAGLPKGVVFSVGGLVVSLVAVIALQAMRAGGRRK
jgi:uncharacterized protein involved in response to NO